MRITIVQGAFLPVPPLMGGAVEKVWFALGKEFARNGHQVTHISRRYKDLPAREQIEGVQHHRVFGFNTRRSLLALKFLDLLYSLRVLGSLPQADILISNTFWIPILVRKQTAGRLYIHIARYPKGQMRFYSHAARLQTVSTAIAHAIQEEVPSLADRIRVIPYPLRKNGTGVQQTDVRRERQVLYVGRIHPEKGLHLLIRAFVAVANTAMQGWRMVIVGSAEVELGGGGARYLQELKRLAEPLAERIEWKGAIFDATQLDGCYQKPLLFAYPSLAERGETFGLAPLEAMSHGCVPLVSNLACFHDHVENGITGFVFDHRTDHPEQTLSAQLARLAQDEELLAVVGRAARKKAGEYRLESIADRFLRDFESSIKARPATSNSVLASNA